jgi:hypothetical protein
MRNVSIVLTAVQREKLTSSDLTRYVRTFLLELYIVMLTKYISDRVEHHQLPSSIRLCYRLFLSLNEIASHLTLSHQH